MALRRYILILLFFAVSYAAKSQVSVIDKVTNQLLFNIFTTQPDPAVLDFLTRYAPSLLDKKSQTPETGTGASSPEYVYELHSFLFTTHPYFNAAFTNGKLELYCRRKKGSSESQVYDVKLWFEFDESQQAEIAYSALIMKFDPLLSPAEKKHNSTNGYQRAQFTDKKAKTGFSHVQLRFTSDNLTQHSYKILFELVNDLN